MNGRVYAPSLGPMLSPDPLLGPPTMDRITIAIPTPITIRSNTLTPVGSLLNTALQTRAYAKRVRINAITNISTKAIRPKEKRID
jgi:hypothetical protein